MRRLIAALAVAGALIRPAAAQVASLGAGALGPPSNGSYLVPIIQELKLDRKYGLAFEPTLYSDPGTLVADFAASRTSHIFAAFFNAANFYVRGMKVKLLFTVSTANHGFVAKDPAIRAADDIKGK